MIRLNFALRRQAHLGREEFQRYWRDVHGPLVASVGRTLHMRRYLQTHTVEADFGDAIRAARGGMEEPFDGIASVWWDRREDLVAAVESSEGQEAGALLLEDERRFIDLSRSPLWLSQEIPQINPMPENGIVATPESSWIKLSYLLNPSPGMSVADCHETWRMDHGHLIRRHSQATRFHRYIQNHTIDDSLNEVLRSSRGAPEAYAGYTEAWFDRYDLERIFASPEGEGARGFEMFLEDERRFIDFERSTVWPTKERVFIDRNDD